MGCWDYYGICKAERPEDVIDEGFYFKESEDTFSIGCIRQDYGLQKSLDHYCMIRLNRLNFCFGTAWILERDMMKRTLKEHPEIYDDYPDNDRIPEDFFTSEYYGFYWKDLS